ncbi:DUF3572 domain-containing protein [Pontivivens ytuae]|uniref:DUF3572 domain-containing protein n=1 Tax=Pontivivens ytuae TaxID=2789856 RepID=A0A7S9LVY0_9RHOB|nr:DUF3572 domain-containing protein [Pontivivens ytuae]
MTPDTAQGLAIDVLGWLATDDEKLGAFLALSGASAGDLRERMREPEFLGFLVDFLMQDEATLIAFCDATGHAYDAPQRARQLLPGGDVPDWT